MTVHVFLGVIVAPRDSATNGRDQTLARFSGRWRNSYQDTNLSQQPTGSCSGLGRANGLTGSTVSGCWPCELMLS